MPAHSLMKPRQPHNEPTSTSPISPRPSGRALSGAACSNWLTYLCSPESGSEVLNHSVSEPTAAHRLHRGLH